MTDIRITSHAVIKRCRCKLSGHRHAKIALQDFSGSPALGFLCLSFLFPPPHSSFVIFQMSRLAALLLLVPAVLAFDYTVGVGKDETT